MVKIVIVSVTKGLRVFTFAYGLGGGRLGCSWPFGCLKTLGPLSLSLYAQCLIFLLLFVSCGHKDCKGCAPGAVSVWEKHARKCAVSFEDPDAHRAHAGGGVQQSTSIHLLSCCLFSMAHALLSCAMLGTYTLLMLLLLVVLLDVDGCAV
jgi:hypothetical protein